MQKGIAEIHPKLRTSILYFEFIFYPYVIFLIIMHIYYGLLIENIYNFVYTLKKQNILKFLFFVII